MRWILWLTLIAGCFPGSPAQQTRVDKSQRVLAEETAAAALKVPQHEVTLLRQVPGSPEKITVTYTFAAGRQRVVVTCYYGCDIISSYIDNDSPPICKQSCPCGDTCLDCSKTCDK
jgi:hypothetical protein